jgi:hypothetical protein
MMTKAALLTALKNLGWLALVAFPAFFLLVWIQALIGGAEGSRDLGYVLETGGFYYLAYVMYVLLGGLVHQISLLFLPRSWSPSQRRGAAVLLTPVIPLLLILLGEWAHTIAEFLIPIILTLVIYGLLIRLPAPQQGPAQESI